MQALLWHHQHAVVQTAGHKMAAPAEKGWFLMQSTLLPSATDAGLIVASPTRSGTDCWAQNGSTSRKRLVPDAINTSAICYRCRPYCGITNTQWYRLPGTKWQHPQPCFHHFQKLILNKWDRKSSEKLLCLFHFCFFCLVPL